jgi:molybdopterin molybdotransferase
MPAMLTFEDAQARIVALATRGGRAPAEERVALDDACGRVLAEEIRSPFDVPAFDYSAMDGYAVATSTLAGGGPWRLDVIGESRTGASPPALTPGSTCRIFTGARIPVGADAVVMQERAPREGDRVTLDARPRDLQHVRRRGEDMAKGAVALAAGTRLRPSHIAMAATVDRAWLAVSRRPVVTILGTGDELRPPGSGAADGTIPESNAVTLRAMARAAGAIVRVAPVVRDDRAATEQALEAALRGTDLLVTVGGVSVGDHDLVRPALEAIGVTLDFWKVAIKPGKPIAVGMRGDALVMGLPGNPASAMVTFALFGLPLLRAMQGDLRPVTPYVPARLTSAVKQEPGRTTFLRASLHRATNEAGRAGELHVTPLSNQASGAVTSMSAADALLLVPADASGLAEGSMVDVLPGGELGL